jgi:hypothetical protein
MCASRDGGYLLFGGGSDENDSVCVSFIKSNCMGDSLWSRSDPLSDRISLRTGGVCSDGYFFAGQKRSRVHSAK